MNGFFRLIIAFLLCSAAAQAGLLQQDNIFIEFHNDDREIAEHALTTLQNAIDEYHPHLPLGQDPIRIAIAHSDRDFLHLVGYQQAGVAGIARPSQGVIIVKNPDLIKSGVNFSGTLRHELLHVLLFRNTTHLPRWLNEGLCMYFAREYRWASTFTMAQMFFSGRIIEYRWLDQAFYAPGTETEFGDAYAQALSMTRFIVGKLGEETLWKVVLDTKELSFGDSLRKHTNLSPMDLWNQYKRSLWKLSLFGFISSGAIFGPAAFLVILAWYRKHRQNQVILEQWAAEEAEDDALGIQVFSWDNATEDPEAWKNDVEEEEPW